MIGEPTDVRFGAHYGLKLESSIIASCPKSAMRGSLFDNFVSVRE
jgi:hypothetical protein